MTPREYVWAAIDIVIDLAAQNGIKYRRGDFDIVTESEYKHKLDKNLATITTTGIAVVLSFGFERTGKKLKADKDNFDEYACCSVEWYGVYFDLSLDDIDTWSAKGKLSKRSKREGDACEKRESISYATLDKNSTNDTKFSGNEIFLLLTKAAKEKNMALTYTHKLFFLNLLNLAEQIGEETDDGLSFAPSVQNLAEALQTPLRTTIQSLGRLADCGVLLREKGPKRRDVTKTTILKKYYERERMNERETNG